MDETPEIAEFKPCQIVYPEAQMTEYVFEDCMFTAVPVVPGVYHAVDWMIGDDGRLVGIQFWAAHAPLIPRSE